jgi:hypothetical protein
MNLQRSIALGSEMLQPDAFARALAERDWRRRVPRYPGFRFERRLSFKKIMLSQSLGEKVYPSIDSG